MLRVENLDVSYDDVQALDDVSLEVEEGAIVAIVGWRDGIHVGVGTLVMLTNVVLLSGYTFGCHSFRHAIGGGVNSYSTAPFGALRFRLWKLSTVLNERHMLFAWMSLFSVGLTDFYIRMVSSGTITDVRLF